jgi:8-oxo-dGTP pyrophosphatase MutT (NUDIX family)
MISDEDKLRNPWKTLGGELKYENNWIAVTEYQVINPSGNQGIYGKVHFKNIAVGVIPLDEDMNTWLVGQYRYTLDEYSWEMPEGGCPIGAETVLDTAKRELLEETGLIAAEWTELLKLHTSNSVTDEVGYAFVARSLIQAEADPEETEDLSLWKLPFDEALQMVLDGKITDAFTCMAFLKLKVLIDKGLI